MLHLELAGEPKTAGQLKKWGLMNEMKTYTAEQELEALQKAINEKEFRPFLGIHEAGSLTAEQVIEYVKLHAPPLPSNCIPFFHSDWKYLSKKNDMAQWPRSSKLGEWLETMAQEDCAMRRRKAFQTQSMEEFFFWPYDAGHWYVIALDKTYSYEWLNVTWQRAVQPEMGFCDQLYARLYTPSGVMCYLQRPDKDDPEYRDAYWPLEIQTINEPSYEVMNMRLEDILWSLRVKPEQILHIKEGFELCPCKVMRQDDHGNEFEIVRFDSHLEGHWYVHDMERAVHKQTYWVQSC